MGKQIQKNKNVFNYSIKKIYFNKVLNHTTTFNLEHELEDRIYSFFNSHPQYIFINNIDQADHILTIYLNEFEFPLESNDPFDNYLKGLIILEKRNSYQHTKSEFVVFLEDLNNYYDQDINLSKEDLYNSFLKKLEIWFKYNL